MCCLSLVVDCCCVLLLRCCFGVCPVFACGSLFVVRRLLYVHLGVDCGCLLLFVFVRCCSMLVVVGCVVLSWVVHCLLLCVAMRCLLFVVGGWWCYVLLVL